MLAQRCKQPVLDEISAIQMRSTLSMVLLKLFCATTVSLLLPSTLFARPASALAVDHPAARSSRSALSGRTSDAKLRYVRRHELWNTGQYLLKDSGHVVSDVPQTRVFNWTIEHVRAQPGGMTKPMIVVNGQSPGPTVHANLGDRLIFHIHNQLQDETAVHWHGQLQNGTNHYDGAYGITQCGIPPGGSMTYNWSGPIFLIVFALKAADRVMQAAQSEGTFCQAL